MWVAGAVDDDTNRLAVEQVPNRTAKTLTGFIVDSVAEESTVHSDCWRSYDSLNSLFFLHESVNHSEKFVREMDDFVLCPNVIEPIKMNLLMK